MKPDWISRKLNHVYSAAFHSSCSLTNREELRNLLIAAGFQDIKIRLEVQMARFPSLEEFIPGYISVFPFANQIKEMTRGDQKRLMDDIEKSLMIFTDDYGLAAPMESHIITAKKY